MRSGAMRKREADEANGGDRGVDGERDGAIGRSWGSGDSAVHAVLVVVVPLTSGVTGIA